MFFLRTPKQQTQRRLAAFGAFWAICFAFALLLHWPSSHGAGHGPSLTHESASCIACQINTQGFTLQDDTPTYVPLPQTVFGVIAPPVSLRAFVAFPDTDSPACLRGPPASAS